MKAKILRTTIILSLMVFSGVCAMDSTPSGKDQASSGNKAKKGVLDGVKEAVKRSYLCDNFAQVCEKRLYKSGVLTAERLAYYIDTYSIKMVINLRNCQPEVKWWQDMSFICKQKETQLVDLETSCNEPVKKEIFERLIKIFKTTSDPILIVDKGGVVRSGEIAALWLLINWDEQTIKKLLEKAIIDAFNTRTQNALGQLSVLNGYFLDCCYGKKTAVKNVGTCIAEKLAHDFVSQLDLKDPFKNSDFVMSILAESYPEKSIQNKS
jgi:hypothetical protein